MSNGFLSGLETFSLGIKALEEFHVRINSYLQELGIQEQASRLQIDHIGVRLKTNEEVQLVDQHIATKKAGNVISRAVVNGREISIVEFNQPLSLGLWKVPCLELPFPASNHSYPNGFEHIEIVLPSEANTLDEFRPVFNGYFPHLTQFNCGEQYSEASPHAKEDQLANPTIAFKKDLRTCIKFHPRSIKKIVSPHTKVLS